MATKKRKITKRRGLSGTTTQHKGEAITALSRFRKSLRATRVLMKSGLCSGALETLTAAREAFADVQLSRRHARAGRSDQYKIKAGEVATYKLYNKVHDAFAKTCIVNKAR